MFMHRHPRGEHPHLPLVEDGRVRIRRVDEDGVVVADVDACRVRITRAARRAVSALPRPTRDPCSHAAAVAVVTGLDER